MLGAGDMEEPFLSTAARDDLPHGTSLDLDYDHDAVGLQRLMTRAPPVLTTFGPIVGATYILNFVMGTGVLTMPFAFQRAGIGLGSILFAMAGIMSFIAASFVLEAQAGAGVLRMLNERAAQRALSHPGDPGRPGPVPLRVLSRIRERVEVGEMAEICFGPYGQGLTFGSLVVYLLGTSTLLAGMMGKTLTEIYVGHGYESTGTYTMPAVLGIELECYVFFLIAVAAAIAPACFGDFQNTKWIQLSGMCVRSLVFSSMLFAILWYIVSGDSAHHSSALPANATGGGAVPAAPPPTPNLWWRPSGGGELLSDATFVFMLHHSLPGLLTPIRPEGKILRTLGGSHLLAVALYLLICVSAVVAFHDAPLAQCVGNAACRVQEMLTDNFLTYHLWAVRDFVVVYPMFNLVIYPLVSITLRNNCKALYRLLTNGHAQPKGTQAPPESRGQFLAARAGALALIWAPFGIACVLRSPQKVTQYTGGFAGLLVMFLIPVQLVRGVRAQLQAHGFKPRQSAHSSPFAHGGWLALTLCWAAGLFVLNCYNLATAQRKA